MIVGHLPIIQLSVCASRGHVRWVYTDATRTNFDVVVFFCVLGFPLIPVSPVHVRHRKKVGPFQYQHTEVPVRWCWGLVFLAWVRRATLAWAVWGIVALPLGIMGILAKNDPDGWALLWMTVAAWAAFPATWAVLWEIDAPTRDMRRIMGNWRWGSSDPMTYRTSWIDASDFVTPRPHYNFDTYAEAAENCWRIHNWWGGMFAARMVQRFDDPELGKQFVERIVEHPEVQDALTVVRSDPMA